jgi:hypothetical protein
MHRAYKLVALSLAACVLSAPALACEPCAKTASLQETIQKAELIIIGERVDYKDGEVWGNENGGPASIQVRVHKALKGQAAAHSTIRVRSYYGMCAYGIYMGNKEQAVLYLSKKGDSYDAVENGCAQKTSLVEGGNVQLDDKAISIEEFSKTYLGGK